MKNMPEIPFNGIDRFYQIHSENILKITDDVYASGAVLMGSAIAEFETQLASYCGRKHAVTVGSCTDALFFSLKVGGVKAQDEVLTTCMSYLASTTPILRIGAKPVFVDVNPSTHQMDLGDLKSKITDKTSAIIAVHLYGQLLDIESLESLAEEKNLLLIEDAAQSLGSVDNNRHGGSMGKLSCISFDPTKIIGAFGNGGAVMTDDGDLNVQLQKLRYHGKNPGSGSFEELGYNSRMATVQAALLNFQLELLPQILKRRNEIASIYNNQLKGLQGVELIPRNGQSVDNYHKYVIRTDKRNELRNYLQECGIQSSAHYDLLIPELPIFDKGNCDAVNIKNAELIKDNCLSLPIYPELTNEEVDRVSSEIIAFSEK